MAAALDRCVRSTSSGLKAAHRQYGLIGNGNAGQTSKSPLLANHRKIKNADQDQSPSRSTVRGLARESPHRRWGQKSVGYDTFAGITLVSARTRCVRSRLASAALASNASFNPSTAVTPQRVVSFINVVGCGTTPSSGINQQHVDPREFLRQPQHLIRQQRLSQRLLIAYRTKDDGLDPF